MNSGWVLHIRVWVDSWEGGCMVFREHFHPALVYNRLTACIVGSMRFIRV